MIFDKPREELRHGTIVRQTGDNMYLVNYTGDELDRVYSTKSWSDGDKVTVKDKQIVSASRGMVNPKTVVV